MWTFVQRSGLLVAPDGITKVHGYSGHGRGLNSPAMQNAMGIGPIPVGVYQIGPPHNPVDHLGVFALPLVPLAPNEMHGRSGFFIHGDNQMMNHSASNGCIILDRTTRTTIAHQMDRILLVVAEEKEIGG